MAFWTNPNKRLTTTNQSDGTLEVFGDFEADETTDLAATIDGANIAKGSLCLVISTGEFYAMTSAGSWANVSTPAGEDANDAKSISTPDTRSVAPAITPIKGSISKGGTVTDEEEPEER